MSDPSFNLQKAVFDALSSAALGTTNIFHTVPANTSLPWVVIGDDQVLSDYEAGDFFECFVTVHVFGKKPSFKNIAMKVRLALDALLTVEDFDIHEAWFEGVNYLTEKDGQTGHAILTFRYLAQAQP